jgi:hypothetical protein
MKIVPVRRSLPADLVMVVVPPFARVSVGLLGQIEVGRSMGKEKKKKIPDMI